MKIEKGIPIPSRCNCQRKELSQTVAALEVGDSFIVEDRTTQKEVLRQAKRHKIKITTRKLNGDGVRVWRVE